MVLFYGSFLVYNFSFVPDGLYNTIRHIIKVVLKWYMNCLYIWKKNQLEISPKATIPDKVFGTK